LMISFIDLINRLQSLLFSKEQKKNREKFFSQQQPCPEAGTVGKQKTT